MAFQHTADQVRNAKREAATRFEADKDVTSIGIGVTEDRSDLAVTITVRNKRALRRVPGKIGTVPVRTTVTGPSSKLL
jgi:hypothetical protein